MRFKAEYLNRATGETYWRTIDAYTLNEAIRLAERFARKGYTVKQVKQEY